MLEAIRWRRGRMGTKCGAPSRHLFLFIGAEPNTDWLADSGVRWTQGLRADRRRRDRRPRPAGDQPAGVFAIGDVRAGSVKRVAAAVGEGAQVVAALHAFLGEPAAKT